MFECEFIFSQPTPIRQFAIDEPSNLSLLSLSMSQPKVLLVGSGGVGAIAALALTSNGKAETTLVVRSDYDKVINEGYTIRSATYGNLDSWRPTHVSKSVEDAVKLNGPFDYVVVTTKNIPDGPQPCEDIILPAVVPGRTTIVLIQNGINIEIPMIRRFPTNHVLSGISLIGSTNIKCVVHNPGKDSILLSPFHNPNVDYEKSKEKTQEFASMYQNPDESVNKITIEDDAVGSRWQKLVYNSVFNTICAITDLDVNRCQINGANKTLFEPAMDEVIAIAASEGVTIDPRTKHRFMHIGDGFFYTPSMLVDARKKQIFEIETILGNPLAIAKKKGVPTPILTSVYYLLKMRQFYIMEETGKIKIHEEDYKGRDSDDYPKIFAESGASN